jgi:ABC-type Zn uptake system ZnuABC Zn-binding protein ZnuA
MNKIGSMWIGAQRALKLSKYLATGAVALALAHSAFAADAKIPVVAAENFYGDVVQQLGGDRVDVTSILSNPDQDPHLFEASPKTARATLGIVAGSYQRCGLSPPFLPVRSAATITVRFAPFDAASNFAIHGS